MDIHRVTVGISGHEPEASKIAIAIRHAHAFSAELCFLHVNDPKAGQLSMAFIDHGVKYDPSTLERYVRHHAGCELPEACLFSVRQGDWLDELAQASSESDLLILGHKHTYWLQAAMTDTLDEMVVNRSNCPVLVVPDKLEA